MAITKHVYQIFIKATPEQVWEAITEPSWTRRYFHGTAFDSPPVKGEPYPHLDRRRSTGGRRDDRGARSPRKGWWLARYTLHDAALSENRQAVSSGSSTGGRGS
jgi:hypothetical protein